MEIKNCPRCGKVFTVMSSQVCPACEKEDEETFKTVREFVEKNPFSTLAEIVEETKVSAKRIQKYIKDGRLQTSQGLHGVICCDGCGTPIHRGRYCDSCRVKITTDVDIMFGKRPEEPRNTGDGPRMHTRHKKNL